MLSKPIDLVGVRILNNIFSELKRRNIFRVIGVYAVVGWLLMQFATVLESSIGLPDWFDGMVVALLLIGFPLAVILAWAFEMTPAGVKRTEAVAPGESIVDKTGRKLDYAILVGLVLVAALVLVGPLLSGSTNVPAPTARTIDTENSVAVLPFVDLSQAGDQEFFADGISEEILNVLVRIPRLKVAGRTSSFSFKGKNEDLRQISTALGVDHVLEGSVRRSGTKLRITAQLIRGSDGFHLWSETYDRELTDIFDIQDEIARSVADQLAVSLGLSSETLVKERTQDLVAYENYLKAHQLFLKRGKDNLDMAMLLAGEAVARDPNYAPAWGIIGSVYTVYESYQSQRIDETVYLRWRALGKAAAKRSIALDPNNGVYHATLGSYYINERRWQEAYTQYDRALELSPDNADVLDSFAQNLLEAGYYSQANQASKRAVAIDPLAAIYRNTLARTYKFIGQNEAGYAALKKAMELDPKLRFPYNGLWNSYVRTGDLDKAVIIIEKGISAGIYAPEMLQDMQNLNRAYDDDEALRSLIGDFNGQSSERFDWHAHVKLGDTDTMMEAVAAGWQNETRQNPDIFNGVVPPVLFISPRWKDQVHKSGILDVWRARGFPANCRPLAGDDFECDNYWEKSEK
jgi:TolB-like protein/Tfp pilus assembly protein PilF